MAYRAWRAPFRSTTMLHHDGRQDASGVRLEHRRGQATPTAQPAGHRQHLDRSGPQSACVRASELGKSHIAAALGHALIELGLQVRYFPASGLIQELQIAKKGLHLTETLRKLNKYTPDKVIDARHSALGFEFTLQSA